MIGSTRALRVFAYAKPVDMRKAYEGLSAIVRDEVCRDLLAGDLFVFVGRRRKTAKVLYFDGTGLCILMKKLARGRFAAPWLCAEGQTLELTLSELALFIEGSEVVGRIRLSPRKLIGADLAISPAR
jgi:transposase